MKYTILVILALVLHEIDGATLRGLTNVRKCWPCSEEVCCASECSTNDPYVCIAGNATGGCNNSPTYWTGTDDCHECCDLSDCGDCEIGRVEKSCGPCSVEVCATNECSDEHPYICTMGNATRGCSNSSTYWTNTLACTECCNKTTCSARVEPTCEKQCSNEVCDKHECSNEHPFACIKAGNESDATNPTYGCNANKTYWLETNLNCDDCCDVRLCFLRAETPIPLPPETTDTDAPLVSTSTTPPAPKTSKSRAEGCGRHCRL